MKLIKNYVDHMIEELEGAKDYAEKYVECKANGNMAHANKYKEMAQQELNHAMNIHSFATEAVDKLSNIYTPPVDMQDKWEHAHKEYVEKAAWIKQMLTL